MLKVSNLDFFVGKKKVLSDIAFLMRSTFTLAILGPSGSGKTSLLRLIMGLERPSRGSIEWDGVCFSKGGSVLVKPESRRFGFVFQDGALFPHLSVLGNVKFGLAHLENSARRVRAMAWLEKVGAKDLASRHVMSLSGGERQRVALARTLATEPKLLLLDEPFSNIDRVVRKELIRILKDHVAETGTSIIHVSHDARDALDLGREVLILRQGGIVCAGATQEILANPRDDWAKSFLTAIT